jgi:release factor glutamine methyltransferase
LFQALGHARERLVEAGLSTTDASIDVDLYARTILGWDRAKLLSEQQAPVPEGLEPTFSQWVARREKREPSAYILGTREFWGLDMQVTPAVLIPRPETEFIVEEAVELARSRRLRRGNKGLPVRAADVGTGSGCVAIALATEMPKARFVATDISADALGIARANAARHGVGERIEFVNTSYLAGVAGPFDLITANPPYVREKDRLGLSKDVCHEPEVALFGGAEGLRDVAGVIDTAAEMLAPGGWLVMEFGYGQEEAVDGFVAARSALRLDHIRGDLQEIPRTAVIQRR